MQDFVQILLLLINCAKYCLDPEPEPEPQLIITVPQHWNPDPTFHCDEDPDSNQSDANLQVPLGNLYCSSAFHLDADPASKNDADPDPHQFLPI
jgi:hypothetical protein